MSDLVKRALQILGTAVVDTGKEYTSNVSSFINDAKDVHSMITKQSTDIADTYNRLKNTNFTKKISDWFYQKESEADLDANEEFDAGIKVDNDSSDSKLDGETTSRPLSTESMNDMFEKSTAAAYKIGRKQTEQSVINTSEIVSTFNSRSSEIITSINNLNKTLIDIRTTLNNFAKAYGSVQLDATNKPNVEDKGSLYSGGQLSLGRIFEASKRSFLEENTVVTTGRDLIGGLLQSGPEGLATAGLQALLGRIKVPGMDKSVDAFAKDLNETIGEAIQTGLSEAIGSKWFQAIFGDIAKTQTGFNYKELTANSYTNKRATFDGMTRMSIVTIIPEMLAKINEALTGKSYHINNTGHWTEGPAKDKFIEVTNNAFASSGIGYKGRTNISKAGMRTVGKQIPDDDIELAGEAMSGMFVNYILNEVGTTNFTINDLKTMDTSEIIADATMMCFNAATHGDERYWAKVCQTIILTLTSDMSQAHKFVSNINTSARAMMDSAKEFAQSGKPNAYQARVIDKSMVQQQFISTKSSTGSIYSNAKNGVSVVDKKSEVDGRVDPSLAKKTRYGMNEYVEGIYEILNRGVNVKVSKKKGKFEEHHIGQRSILENDDDTFARAFLEGATKNSDEKNLKNIIRMSMEETTNSLLGIENANKVREGGIAALLSGNGFLGSAIGAFGAEALKSAANGTLGQDFAARKDNVVNTAKGGVDKITAAVNNLIDAVAPGVLRNNRTLIGVKSAFFGEGGFIDEATGKVADTVKSIPGNISSFVDEKAAAFMDKTVDKNGRFGKFINKALYNKDTKVLNATNKLLDDYIPENEIDGFYLSACRRLIEEGRYSTAQEMSENISDSSVKALVQKTIAVCQKRYEGAYAIADGSSPASIGAVSDSQLQTFIDDKGKGKAPSLGKSILSTIGNGIKNIGSLIAKLYAFLWKSFKSGAQDIFYGGRSWIRGWTTILSNTIGKPIVGGVKFIVGIVGAARKFIKETAWPWFYKGLHNIHTMIKTNLAKIMDVTKSALGGLLGRISSKAGDWFNKKFGNFGGANSGIGGAFIEGLTEPWREKKKSLKQDEAENPLMKAIRDAVDNIKDKMPEPIKEKNIEFSSESSSEDNTSTVSETNPVEKVQSLAKDKESHPLLTKIYDLLESWTNNIDEITNSVSNKKEGKKVKVRRRKKQNGMEDLGDASSTDLGGSRIADDVQMDDLSISAVSEPTSAGWSAGGVTNAAFNAAKAVGGKLGWVATLAKGIGQVFGGTFKLIVGPLKMIASAVTGFTVVKELIADVKKIVGESIKQLQPLVEEVAKTLKKFMPAIKAVADTVVDMIKSIATPIIATLEPMMKQLVPQIVSLVKTVSNIVTPILVGIAEKILPKVVYGITFMLKGLNKVIGVIEIVSGTLRFVFGMGLAKLGSFVTEFGKKWGKATFWNNNDDDTNAIIDAGQKMGDVGTDIAQKGVDTYREGIRSWTGDYDTQYENTDTKDYSGTVDTSKVQLTNEFGSGDVTNNNTTINNSYSYTYGSGNVTNNQQSYGNYMNMSQRGCGPVALAEVFNRRTGGDLNARTLASSMLSSGAYTPSKGTSIASMISTGRALGMNLRAGDVTRESLKGASPSNPITVYGSGTGFGTRRGNGHYVNVVGSDSSGNVLVSNPLSGKVSRQNISSIIANSKLGLYGSGDYDAYGFDEGTQTAFSKLKELTDRLTGMFQLKDSADSAVEKAEIDSQYNDITMGMTESDWAEMRSNSEFSDAVNGYAKYVKRQEGETDSDYNRRVEKAYLETTSGKKLVIKLGASKRKSSLDAFGDWMQSHVDTAKFDLENSKISSDGGIEMAAFAPIIHTETNITSSASNESPVHDFFAATNEADRPVYTTDGGWYLRANNPYSTGEGRSGSDSDGILFRFNSLPEGVSAKIKAITSGTVTYVGRNGEDSPNANGGLGNHVKWKDLGGMYHWYYHLGRIDPSIAEGSQITGGQVIGYVGKDVDKPTGLTDADSSNFGYTLSRVGPYGSTGDGTENPLGYWKFHSSEMNVSGDSNAEVVWNVLRYKGLTAEQAAGVLGNLESESGILPQHLEKDNPMTSISTDYTADVNANNISAHDFINNIQPDKYRHFGPGYGLAQWTTVDRKERLYAATKGKGKPIDDLQTQAAFLLDEPGMENVIAALKNQSSVEDASWLWLSRWEKPDKMDEERPERASNAQKYYNMFKNNPVQSVIVADENGRHDAITGTFKSTYANRSSTGGDNIDLIRAMASAFLGYQKVSPSGAYSHGNVGRVTAPDGYVWEAFRPDCSGFTAAAMRKMGYTFKGSENDITGPLTYDFNEARAKYGVKVIRDENGNETSDWELVPYNMSSLTPGDILFTDGSGSSSWPDSHTDMFIGFGKDGGIRALDGGNVGPINASFKTSARIINDDVIEPDLMQYNCMSDADAKTSGIILRYVGAKSSSDDTTGSIKGGLTHNLTTLMKNITSSDTRIKPVGTATWNPMLSGTLNSTGTTDFSDWWDISTWSKYTDAQRNTLYDYLADKDVIAQNKGNYSQVYPPTYAKDFAEMYNSWTNYGPTDHPDFPHKEIQEQLDSLYRQTGAGDVSSISSADIPAIDFSKLTDNVNETVTPYVNMFNIKPDSSSKDEMLKKMSQMTFNVRAQRVEELLEDLIDIVSEGKNKTPVPVSSNNHQADPFLFNNEIPPQVTRLARG